MDAAASDTESLVAVGRVEREDQERTTSWNVLRQLDSDEAKASLEAFPLLRAVTTDSPYADLSVATDDLHEQIGRLEGAARLALPETASRVRRVHREFKAWLSAFKSFDDRTKSWLSREVGKEHVAYSTFTKALNHEFDNNFGYRLCCALRNVSEHSADVINSVKIASHLSRSAATAAAVSAGQRLTSRQVISDADVVHTTLLSFDGPRLANDHDQIKAKMREELRSVTELISAEAVVGSAVLSCQRAHAAVLVALWPHISPAAEIVERHHREALNSGGVLAQFVSDRSLDEHSRAKSSSLTLRPNPIELAESARHEYARCKWVLAQPPTVYEWADLVQSNP